MKAEKKVRKPQLCAGASELHAFLWNTCSEDGGISVICGWSFWLSSEKKKNHLLYIYAGPLESSMVLTGLNWESLDP